MVVCSLYWLKDGDNYCLYGTQLDIGREGISDVGELVNLIRIQQGWMNIKQTQIALIWDF